jgi:hypothetical protein
MNTITNKTQSAMLLVIAGAAMTLASMNAQAVPSFARQTGMGCGSCHTIFPALTQFGRQFKLNGYTLQGLENAITTAAPTGTSQTLNIDKIPPFSAMVQASLTHTSKTQPVDTTTTSPGVEPAKNNDILFPDQLSFFFAGEIAPRAGIFMQITYTSQSAKFDWDNTDLRYANHKTVGSSDLLYGLTLNNNPTVQDVWHSTPAWSFPFASSSVAPTPAASALIDGTLGQAVTGLTAYGLWNNLLYAEVGAYRSSPTGVERPLNGGIASDVIESTAPYWRLALQKQFENQYLEVGAYGIAAKLYPGAALAPPAPLASPTDDYTDTALDAQYELPRGDDLFTAHATYIHEKQSLNASVLAGAAANTSNHLNTFRADAGYYFHSRYAATLGYFSTTGSSDAVLYAPTPLTGSASGSPNSKGAIAELDYLPWLNTKFSLQYVAYDKFNGARTNYDGSGRDAKDNNTTYLLAWLLF